MSSSAPPAPEPKPLPGAPAAERRSPVFDIDWQNSGNASPKMLCTASKQPTHAGVASEATQFRLGKPRGPFPTKASKNEVENNFSIDSSGKPESPA